MTEQHKYN